MTSIQIEADVSPEQLLRAVEQLPPREFTMLLAHLLVRVRSAASSSNRDMPIPTEEDNPYLAARGMFADDAFAAEVNAYISAQRDRERYEVMLR